MRAPSRDLERPRVPASAETVPLLILFKLGKILYMSNTTFSRIQMPCGCEEKEFAKLRFVGGVSKRPTGPYMSFETGKIYEVPAENEQLSYWEAVDEEMVEKEYAEQTEKEELPSKSRGLTRQFGSKPLSPEDFVLAMDDNALKSFVEEGGTKVDGRWGRKRLVEEALKLQ